MVKASASIAAGPCIIPAFPRGDFSGSSHTSDFKIGTPVLPCQVPGDEGSAVGLVGPVSVYCDLVRYESFDLQLLSQFGSTFTCLSRSVPEIH